MNTQEFLDLVLPSEDAGIRVIGYLKNGSKYFDHTTHATNEEAAQSVANLAAQGLNVYHALASYKRGHYVGSDGKRHLRTHANVAALKSFWMDLDVKPGVEGHYQTRNEAIDALKQFCIDSGIPRPFLVGSGRYGVHAYWVMDTEMPLATWKPRADALKALAIQHGLLADHAITADGARVLRPVGSYNMKLGRDLVELLTAVRTYHAEDFFAMLEGAAAKFGVTVNTQLLGAAPSHIPQGSESNVEVKFDQLPVSLDKVVQHCELLAKSYETGGAADAEPVWYACMGIAGFTDNPEQAVISLAGKHRDFDLANSLKRVAQWRAKTTGPTTCRKLQEAHGSQCKSCPHNGKITTPLQLGRYVLEAEAPVISSAELGLSEFQIPNPPAPFKRGQDKGVYYELEDASGASTPVKICSWDMFPVRISECERKAEYNVLWRVDLPHAGVKDVMVPASMHTAEGGKLMGALASKGVLITPKNAKTMQEYMVSYVLELQRVAPAAVQYAKMGWRETGEFVTPLGACSQTGFVEFPAVPPFVKELDGLYLNGKPAVAGSLDGWVRCLRFYNDPRYTAHQLGFLLAAASPLLHFTNVSGVHTNLVGESGSGKTTVGYVANAMWGHPVSFGLSGTKRGATINALFRRIAMHNNVAVVIDEVSNWDGEQVGEMLYSISQGVGRLRMNGAESFAQAEHWCLISQSSSNQPLAAKAGAYKADSYAEQMRLLEFRCEQAGVHSKGEADLMLRSLKENYGHAGPLVMQFIVEHKDAIVAKLHKVMETLDADANIQSSERFWSAALSCAIVMGAVMRKLGYIQWDLDRISRFAVQCVKDSRKQTQTSNAAAQGLFNTMLDAHIKDTLILASNGAQGGLGGQIETPLQAARGKLLIRKEMGTGKLYVASALIRQYCQQHNVDVKLLEDEVVSSGALLDKQCRKVLGAGTIESGGQVRCWELDWSKLPN